jgi:drug/metabolite transporter (DMT)-like permease
MYQRRYPGGAAQGEVHDRMFNPERFAIRLMVVQAVLFSMETALVHYLGQALSIVQFGAVRGLGGVLTSMFFARTFNIFRTEQFRLHLIRGITALTYGWVLVYSFGQLPLADATAISYTQTIWIALLSLLILHETISRLRWLSVVVGVTGALLIAKPSFAALGVVYLVALFGTSLNALNFVLNRYSNLKDSQETTMAYTNLFTILGNVPLCFLFTSAPDMAMLSWFLLFLFVGPLGMFAGIVALNHADASLLGPYTLLRLVIGVIGGTVIFFELPGLWTSIGIGLICLSCVLALNCQKWPVRRAGAGF